MTSQPQAPKSFQRLSGLADVAIEYDAVFCDIWGVVHNGRRPNFAACGALERYRDEVGPVVLMSNTSRPSALVPESFAHLEMPDGFFDAIVTSGDAIVNELARRSPGPAFLIGEVDEEGDEGFGLFDQVPMNFADMDAADFVVCTRPYDYGDSVEDYEDLLGDLLDRELEMVCTNPDVKVKVDGREVMCAGAIAQAYERMGGTAVYGGKPHPPIYQLGRAWLEETLGYRPSRILMIGDNLFTDVLGAQREGIDCLFIQDGLYGATAEEFRTLCERHGIAARYQLPELAW
ncbi:MAG: TIGR01459 family HAD-type hydrolase [Litorimonas sp.]